jgi:hypothetical protein
MFIHKIGKGYKIAYTSAVAEINGTRIRNLKHLVETLRDAKEEFVEFTFHGRPSEGVVFKRKDVPGATEEILSDNGIRQQCSPDIAPVWKQPKN